MEFSGDIQLINLELFDAAFPVAPGEDGTIQRRFMTLFAQDARIHRGSGGEVLKVSNAQGETFALKRLTVAKIEGMANDGSNAAATSARLSDTVADLGTIASDNYSTCEAVVEKPVDSKKKILRSSFSGTASLADIPDYVTQGHATAFYEEYRVQLAVSGLRGFPRVYGFGLSEGNPVIVMEWVEGTTLRDAMRKRDSLLSLTVIADLGIAVLEVLARAAELDDRFVHRDISPRNIMLRDDHMAPAEQLNSGNFDLCLLDFGSSALSMAGDAPDPTFTMNANIWRMGTPAYAPPEMLSADIDLPTGYRQSPTIDTYALCSVLYELYAGRKPYRLLAQSDSSPYRLKTETAPDALTPRDPEGGALANAVMTGLSPQQGDRPSVRELKTALENWKAFPGARTIGSLRGAKPADRSMWQPDYARKALTRRAVLAAGIVAAGVAAAAIIVGTKPPSRAAAVDAARYKTADKLYDGEALFKTLDGHHPGWALCTAEGVIACKPTSSRECGALREGLVALYDDMSQLYGYITPIERAIGANENTSSAANDAQSSTKPNENSGESGYAWHILPSYAQAADYSEGLAAVQDADTKLWGYIDTRGSWAIEPRFRAGGPFSNGIASARANDTNALWGAVDMTGAWTIEPRFAALGVRSASGYATAQGTSNNWGIVDDQGNWTCDARFPNLRRTCDCRLPGERPSNAPAQTTFTLTPALDSATNLWGYIDPSCAWAIAPSFRAARPFYDDLAAVQDAKTQLWYFIDPDGSPHNGMKPRFWKLGDMHDGLAPAQASAEDDVVVFDESHPDARSEFAGMRYGYVDAFGNWQMKRLTTLVDTAIGIPEI